MLNQYWRTPFADGGDKAAIPEAVQPDGSVSLSQGFGPNYELPYSNANSKDIPRDKSNQLDWLITKSLQEYQQNGIPDWIDPSQNGGVNFGYPQWARVRYSDGAPYMSLIAANTALPTDATKWIRLDAGNFLNAQVFSTPGSFTYTPTPGTRKVRVRCLGGGGAGGGTLPNTASQVGAGEGGGSGSYAEGLFLTGFSGVTVTVGAVALGNAGGNGSNGNASSFGGLITSPGGPGGAGGSGARASVFPVTFSSGTQATNASGGNLFVSQGSQGGPLILLGLNAYVGGAGGNSVLGGGGGLKSAPSSQLGQSAAGFGAGGGGAVATAGAGANLQGGNGAQGLVIVEEYT